MATCLTLTGELVKYLAFVSIVLCLGGCGPSTPPPETQPVVGSAKFSDGKPITSGALQFQSTTDKQVVTVGEVKLDGSFTLETLRDGHRVPGAMAGEYNVTYTPPMGDAPRMISIRIPHRVTIVTGENQVTLTVPVAGGGRR